MDNISVCYLDSLQQGILVFRNKDLAATILYKPDQEKSVHPIIFQDINDDKLLDIIFPINNSDNLPLISYYVFVGSASHKFCKPKLAESNKTVDFFSSRNYINYNMRIVHAYTLMFQEGYSTAVFCRLSTDLILLLAKISRTNAYFNEICC